MNKLRVLLSVPVSEIKAVHRLWMTLAVVGFLTVAASSNLLAGNDEACTAKCVNNAVECDHPDYRYKYSNVGGTGNNISSHGGGPFCERNSAQCPAACGSGDPEIPSGELLASAVDALLSSADADSWELLAELVANEDVVWNAERSAIQVQGCSSDQLAYHRVLSSAEQAAFSEAASALF